jgi:hypothetical protein
MVSPPPKGIVTLSNDRREGSRLRRCSRRSSGRAPRLLGGGWNWLNLGLRSSAQGHLPPDAMLVSLGQLILMTPENWLAPGQLRTALQADRRFRACDLSKTDRATDAPQTLSQKLNKMRGVLPSRLDGEQTCFGSPIGLGDCRFW